MRLSRLFRPRTAAYTLAALLALAFADSVYRIPVQVSDSLDVIVESAKAPSATRLLVEAGGWSADTLRPMRYVQARGLLAVANATGLSYNTVFRGAHAAIIVLMLLVFVACIRIDGWLDVAALAFCLTVLTGLHTFGAVMREAFPVNHYAEVALVSLVAFAVARRRPRWISQALLLLLLAWCLLLIESAVLIWVVIVMCAALRMPGIRWRTALVATLMLVAYAGGRQALEIASPGIGARGSGWGGVYYSGAELRERFSDNPFPLYAYNTAGGLLTVLFSEPRFGVYELLRPDRPEGPSPVVPINIAASALVTTALAIYAAMLLRRREGVRPDDRAVIVGLVVVGISAGLCLTYIKDEIVSTAGAFYALAAFAPIRAMLGRATAGPTRLALLITAFFIVAAPLWAFRTVGTHFELRRTAYYSRNDWAGLLPPGRRESWPSDPVALTITSRLKNEALQRRTISPRFLPRWGERYWVE